MPTDEVIIKAQRQTDRSAEEKLLQSIEQQVDAYAMNEGISKEDVAKRLIDHFDKYRMKNS